MRAPGSELPVICGHGGVDGEGGCQLAPVVAGDSLSAACPQHPEVVVDLTPAPPVDLSGLVCAWDGTRNLALPAREPHADRRRP